MKAEVARKVVENLNEAIQEIDDETAAEAMYQCINVLIKLLNEPSTPK